MKHTPGPWNVSCDKWRITVVDNAHTGIWRMVAECKTQEDAQLVAAAPEMFEALGAVIESVDECFRDIWRGGGHDTQHFCPMCNCTTGHEEDCPIPAVQAAYNKARGGAK